MKRFITILLALTMLASVGSTVYAEESGNGSKDVEMDGSSDNIGVYGIYDSAKYETVYSVNVQWNDLVFTCSVTGNITWDPGEHRYTDHRTFTWTPLADNKDNLNEKNTDTKKQRSILVTNNSNANVYAKAELQKETAIYDLDLSVSPADTNVELGNKAYNIEADNSQIFTVTIKEPTEPAKDMKSGSFKVGTITITVSATSLDSP